jgi:hypothetical protein
LCSIFYAKWHEDEFIEAKWGDYGRLWNVTLIHGNLIITFAQIKFCENFGTMEKSGKVLHIGQRIFIMCGDIVETTIITTRTPRTIWFGNHVQGSGPW